MHLIAMSIQSKLTPDAERKLQVWVWVVTAAVLVLVGLMRRPELHVALPAGVSFGFLPAVYSTLNALVAVCLVLAVRAAKRGDIAWHRRLVTVSLMMSGLFLVGYVVYHFTSAETKFAGTGWVRPVYFFLLITHITLAAASLPCILLAYLAGWADRRAAHRRLVRWVFPLWLYVAVTGPVVYLMLHFCGGD